MLSGNLVAILSLANWELPTAKCQLWTIFSTGYNICWQYLLTVFVDNICWQCLLTILVDNICWQYLLTIFVYNIFIVKWQLGSARRSIFTRLWEVEWGAELITRDNLKVGNPDFTLFKTTPKTRLYCTSQRKVDNVSLLPDPVPPPAPSAKEEEEEEERSETWLTSFLSYFASSPDALSRTWVWLITCWSSQTCWKTN